MTTKKATLPKWNAERQTQLAEIVGAETPVSAATVTKAAEALETTDRSVASKLRKMGRDVESNAAVRAKAYTPEQEQKLREFVEENPETYTYAEIAAFVLGDESKAKSVQGKLLSMELTDKVKKLPPKEVVKKYTDEEESTLLDLAAKGSFLEDIAEAMNRPLNSIRGKFLSLSRSHGISIPKQKESHAKEQGDALSALEDVGDMTVADIAESIGKTVRGVKSMLTHRGICASDYDGAAKAAKRAKAE